MRIGIVVLALAVAGCGVWTSTPGNVGDCAVFTDMARDRSELSKVDCSAPEAMYKLVDTVSGRSPTCPRGDYVGHLGAQPQDRTPDAQVLRAQRA